MEYKIRAEISATSNGIHADIMPYFAHRGYEGLLRKHSKVLALRSFSEAVRAVRIGLTASVLSGRRSTTELRARSCDVIKNPMPLLPAKDCDFKTEELSRLASRIARAHSHDRRAKTRYGAKRLMHTLAKNYIHFRVSVYYSGSAAEKLRNFLRTIVS